MTIQDHHRSRIVAAMKRRGLTCKDVARMASVHERTVQRFVEGETFDLGTLAKVEAALRLGAVGGDATTDSGVGKRVNLLAASPDRPVYGWKQASQVLGMSVWTLWWARTKHADGTVSPWWRSQAAVMKWYQRMIGQEGE